MVCRRTWRVPLGSSHSSNKSCSLNIHSVLLVVYTCYESYGICRIEWVVLNGTELCLWRWLELCVLYEALVSALKCCEGPWEAQLFVRQWEQNSLHYRQRTIRCSYLDSKSNIRLSYPVQIKTSFENEWETLCCHFALSRSDVLIWCCYVFKRGHVVPFIFPKPRQFMKVDI